MLPPSKFSTLSNRIYCLLLYLYPSTFRREYGYHMAQLFRDDVRDTLQESGPFAVFGLWLLAFFDLLKTAIAEHIWEVFNMPIEKFERWTGLAAALGGALLIFATLAATQFVILALIVVVMFLMWALALGGLYRRLPTVSHHGNKASFAISIISILLSVIGLLILFLTEVGLTLIGFGYFGLGLGIAGMGIIAFRHRVMGVWRFVPLLLAVVWLVFIIVYFIQDFMMESPVAVALILLNGVCWLLLGIGLWTSAKDEAGPALQA